MKDTHCPFTLSFSPSIPPYLLSLSTTVPVMSSDGWKTVCFHSSLSNQCPAMNPALMAALEDQQMSLTKRPQYHPSPSQPFCFSLPTQQALATLCPCTALQLTLLLIKKREMLRVCLSLSPNRHILICPRVSVVLSPSLLTRHPRCDVTHRQTIEPIALTYHVTQRVF